MIAIQNIRLVPARRTILVLLAFLYTLPASAQGIWQMAGGDLAGGALRDPSTLVVVGEFGKILVGASYGTSWSLRSAPTSETLNAVAFGSSASGVSVGNSGVILRTSDGGDTWAAVPNGGWSGLTDVQAVSPTEYFAVGSLGRVLHSTDAGAHWETIPIPSTAILHHITFKTSQAAVIVGESGTTFLSNDGGRTWAKGPDLDPVTYYSCAFRDSLNGIAVGGAGSVQITTDGGGSWMPAVVTSEIDNLRDVRYVSKDTVLAGGFSRAASKIIRSVDGGRTWGGVDPPGMQAYAGVLNLVQVPGKATFAIGRDHLILRSSDRGGTWETISSMPTTTTDVSGTVQIRQIGCVDSLHLFATGDASLRTGGWFYYSSDGGATWRYSQVDTYEGLTGMIVVSRDTIAALGRPNSRLYTTEDGGRSWTRKFTVTRPDRASFQPGRIHMVSDSIGYVLTGDTVVWRTRDVGASWEGALLDTLHSEAWSFAARVSFPTVATGYTAAYGLPRKPPFSRFGALYRSDDSGKTWYSQVYKGIPALSGISFRNVSFGVACSSDSGAIFRTIDGGSLWSRVFSDTSISFNDILLVDDTLGYASAGGSAGPMLFETRDGGKTWNRSDIAFKTSNGRVGLLDIYSPDSLHVYIAGINQLVFKYLGARTPVSVVRGDFKQHTAPPLRVTAVIESTKVDLDWSSLGFHQAQVRICDALGHVVYSTQHSTELGRTALDVTLFPAGKYFVSVDGANGIHGTTEFVILR